VLGKITAISKTNTGTEIDKAGLNNGKLFGVNVTGLTGTSANGLSKALVTGDVPATPTVTGLHGVASVQLNWSAPATNGLPITAYRVSYRPSASEAWTEKNKTSRLGNI
jgi:hypothetical protein